jgi:N,N-dimethylformamidase beta subunit-like, C-terminal/FlgD Ig-like domain
MRCHGRVPALASRAVLAVLGMLALVPGTKLAAQTNRIVAENAMPGSPASEWDIVGSGDASIQGFATEISVAPSETIGFKVSTPATDYRIDIYRLGYYGGAGARHVATVQPSVPLPQVQPACLYEAATRLADCGNWALSASWTVPAGAVSGIYIAKLVREDPEDGRASHIAFVVRDDEGHSDLLVQTSDTTWQAYNRYLNVSLYTLPRAYKVSYNRPNIVRGGNTWDWLFNAEYPLLRWLEHNGYDVSYTTDVDTGRRGAELLEYRAFVSVGHDEYWSRGQREAVEAARDAGVHLVFLSGNEVYWKTRWEPSIDASSSPYRTLVCYKETHAGAKIDPLPDVWTGLWRDCSFSPPADGCDPENQLTGQISWTTNLCGGLACGIQVPAAYGQMRLWRDTDIATLPPNGVATLPAGTLGHEWDYWQYAESSPPGLVWLSSTTVSGLTHHLTLYRHPSGALVFGVGTIQWVWGLDDNHTVGHYPPFEISPPDPRMQQATVNILAEMGVQPLTLQAGLVLATPTGDETPPSSTILGPRAGDSLLAETVVIHGTASDDRGHVGCVEVSTDGGATWSRADGLESWSFAWDAPPHAGNVTLRSRAADDLGNLEVPTVGVGVFVGGAPVEIVSASPSDAVYVNGVETAQVAVTTFCNGTDADSLSVHVMLDTNLGDHIDLGVDPFSISSGTPHTSVFGYVLPASGFPREFALTAELFRGATRLQTEVRRPAFAGMELSRAELAAAIDLWTGPSGCAQPGGACMGPVVDAIPYFGSASDFSRALVALCPMAASSVAGAATRAGLFGLAALEPAVELVERHLPQAGAVAVVVPMAITTSIACAESLIASGTEEPGHDSIDSLAVVLQSVLAQAGLVGSNEILLRGPAWLRLGRDAHWTSPDVIDLRQAVVFDLAGAGFQWGHVGPEPLPLGTGGTNPSAQFDFEVRATDSGLVDLGVLHRTATDSILWLRYAPITVTSKTILRAQFQKDFLLPWGYALFLDTNGDGRSEDILYPGGLTPSDATPALPPQLALLPIAPNPFNPSTVIHYDLPAAGPVQVTILDVRGRVVRRLWSGFQTPGRHDLSWDGALDGGLRAPSGVYVVRVVTADGTATRKITLLN